MKRKQLGQSTNEQESLLSNDSEILDEQQQDKIIKELEQSHSSHRKIIRLFFVSFGLCFISMLAFSIYLSPFTSLFNYIAMFSFLETTWRLVKDNACCLPASVAFAFAPLAYALVLKGGEFPNPLEYSFIYTPILYNVFAVLLLKDLMGERGEIEQLKQKRYHHKSA